MRHFVPWRQQFALVEASSACDMSLVAGANPCSPSRSCSFSDLVTLHSDHLHKDDAQLLSPRTAKVASPSARCKEHKDPQQAPSAIFLALGLTAVISLLYMLASSIAILVNRHLLVDLNFPYPMTITWLGLVTTTVLSAVGVHVWLPKSNRKGITMHYYLTHVMPCGFFMAVAFVTGNMAFMYLTLAFVQMLKAFTPFITMVLLFSFQLEAATARLIMSVCIICFGVLVAAYGEVQASLIGVAVMLTSVCAESLRLVLMQFLMDPKGGELHPMEGVMYISSACMMWLLAQAMIWEWTSLFSTAAYHQVIEMPGPFVMSACAGFAVNLLAILVIKRASSLTLKVLGAGKDAALVLISVLVLREQVGNLQLLGYSVSLVGFVLYNIVKASGPPSGAAQGSTCPSTTTVGKLA